MDVDVGAAKALFACRVERQLIKDLARVPGSGYERLRANTPFQERLFQVQTPQYLHDIGAKDDAGTNPGKCRRLLMDGYAKSCTLQETGARQSSKASAHDSDPLPALHAFTS